MLEKSGIVPREEVKGSCTVDASYEGQEFSLPMLVVAAEGPALLKRNWMEEIKLKWPRIKQPTSHDKRLEEILQKHVPLSGKSGDTTGYKGQNTC